LSTQNKRNPLSVAIKNALLTGTALTFAAAPIFAADHGAKNDSAKNDEDNRIIVTGSRIKRVDSETAAPVQMIDREEIIQTGLTSVGDILQNIPAAGSALNTTFNNGGNGETRIDLRNLGSNRLLVLVNGRRWNPGIGGAVDLNNIPANIIERIEVLKDGASAIYGSDAITGVINIITRQDFQGMEASAQTGQNAEGDGKTQQYDLGMGMTGEKGSAYLNVSYTQQEPIMAGDRPISAVPVFGAPTGYAGSSGTPTGRFLAYTPGFASYFDLTGDGNGNLIPWDNVASRYNYAPENYLLTPQERVNVFGQASYEISDNTTFKTEIFYGNRKSNQLLAPTPLFVGLFASGLGTQTVIGANNPFNPFGYALDSTCSDPAAGCLLFSGRRMIEAGHRVFNQNVNQFQWNAGFNGSFAVGENFFDWDFNYSHAEVKEDDTTTGLLNMQRVNLALSDACLTTADCVPLNLFGGSNGVVGDVAGGTITQQMLDYILFTAHSTAGTTQNEFTFNVSGELMELPGGPMGFAFGLSQREQDGFDSPDALIALGITSGNIRKPTSGGFALREGYVELDLPVLDSLEFSLASRYSDYNNFGTTTNSKFGFKWDVFEDLALRGTYAQGFRAPSVSELFSGRGDSFPQLQDPCSDYLTTGDATTIANCQADGVPSSYTQPNTQIRITVGGNPDLGPEESTSKTLGLVYNPSFVDDLSITVDAYDIRITNAVSTVGAQSILDSCFATSPRTLCNFVSRNSAGGVSDLFNGNINVDTLTSKGTDFNVKYKMDTSAGEFRFNWDTSYVDERGQIVQGQTFNFAGRAFSGIIIPRIRSNLSTTWTMDDITVNWTMRYISSTIENCALGGSVASLCNRVGLGENGSDENQLGTATYHDVQASYNLSDYDSKIRVGINNIGDKNPAFSTTAFANSFDPTQYEIPGRVWYVRVDHSF